MSVRALARWLALAVAPMFATGAHAGLLATAGPTGVRPSHISVCFVSDAATAVPDFIAKIRGFLQEHEAAANIHYDFQLSCPAPTSDAQGNDVFAGDLRVLLMGASEPYSPPPDASGVRRVPGRGCTATAPTIPDPMTGLPEVDADGNQIDQGASWGAFPSDDTPEQHHCQFDMRLAQDGDSTGPFRNHTLHEFGHSLGFAHEMGRYDYATTTAGTVCPASWGGGATTITTEPYDIDSTMNYTMANCPLVGNYSQAGLRDLERISLHIMYPEDARVAEYLGRIVLRAGEGVDLTALWAVRGASLTHYPMITSYQWTLDGAGAGMSASVHLQWPQPGTHTLQLTYTDFAGRSYQTTLPIRVLNSQKFAGTAAVAAATVSP